VGQPHLAESRRRSEGGAAATRSGCSPSTARLVCTHRSRPASDRQRRARRWRWRSQTYGERGAVPNDSHNSPPRWARRHSPQLRGRGVVPHATVRVERQIRVVQVTLHRVQHRAQHPAMFRVWTSRLGSTRRSASGRRLNRPRDRDSSLSRTSTKQACGRAVQGAAARRPWQPSPAAVRDQQALDRALTDPDFRRPPGASQSNFPTLGKGSAAGRPSAVGP
jgi:hypothetical protein